MKPVLLVGGDPRRHTAPLLAAALASGMQIEAQIPNHSVSWPGTTPQVEMVLITPDTDLALRGQAHVFAASHGIRIAEAEPVFGAEPLLPEGGPWGTWIWNGREWEWWELKLSPTGVAQDNSPWVQILAAALSIASVILVQVLRKA